MPPRRNTPPAPDLEVIQVPINTLSPDPDNERVHGQQNLDTIEASLKRFGQRKPLVVLPDMTVIAGNGNLQVMTERLGWTEVWVTVFPGTAEEARAFAINDNRSAELADWDDKILAKLLGSLDSDLQDAAGFAPDAVSLLLKSNEQADAAATRNTSKYEAPAFAGQTPGLNLDERGDNYAEKATRTIYFELPKELFEWLVERISAYRTANGLLTNSDALAAMVSMTTGSPAPE